MVFIDSSSKKDGYIFLHIKTYVQKWLTRGWREMHLIYIYELEDDDDASSHSLS